MISLNVYSQNGDAVGTVEIDPAEFGGKVNRQLLHDAVLMYLANRRRGTHSTLRRGEVAGSTRKLSRQKGTGRARVGTRRTNKRRGGGTAKGPKPRDYEYHLPRRALRTATRMAILSKFLDHEAVILDRLELPAPKTRHVAAILSALKLDGQSCLLGLPRHDEIIYRAARNIARLEIAPVSDFNAYLVLKQKRLLLTREALESLRQRAAAVAAS
ncbi:MAG: 50S ribosomal protein L4 [Gemmataceae bacterium]